MHKPTNKEMANMNPSESVLDNVLLKHVANGLEETAQRAWQATLGENLSETMVRHMRKMHDVTGGFVKIPEVWNEEYIPKQDDTTVLVFDRADFLHGIDKDDMVPALVLCDRKADTLLRKVVENSVDNLQTFLSTGVMPGTDYSLFSEVVSFDDEDDAESVVTPAAGQIISRMVMMADNLLKDTIDPNVLRDADITTVNIKSNRLEIVISK